MRAGERNCGLIGFPQRETIAARRRPFSGVNDAGPGAKVAAPTIERPQIGPNRFSMKHLRLFAIGLVTAIISPAFAAEPVYPPGVRVGLVPLVGLAPAKTFSGFETEDHSVKVLMTELPAAAFAEVETSFKSTLPAGAPKPESIETAAGKAYYTVENAKEGSTTVRRYAMILSGGVFSGYVAAQIPENAVKIYTDDAVRQMFASAVIRKEVPVEEQLALLPFKLTDLGAFKSVHTLAPGSAILLSDGDEETKIEAAAFMVIGSLAAAPAQPDDRGRFAQQAAATIPGLRDARITMSEPVRIDGQPGYETRLDATSGKQNAPVTVVQWLRFGGTTSVLRIIASSPRDEWPNAFPRFRAVRDGIQPR
jgi:hypothetical protein